MVFTQCNPPMPESEVLDNQDLKVLDKTSLTSVVDFMRKFQSDATFCPPTVDVMFDSEKYDISIDSDEEYPSLYGELDELDPSEFK